MSAGASSSRYHVWYPLLPKKFFTTLFIPLFRVGKTNVLFDETYKFLSFVQSFVMLMIPYGEHQVLFWAIPEPLKNYL